MENQLISYFKGEKIESLVFMILGILTIIISFWIFLKGKDSFLNGLAYPLVLMAVIQVVVGGTVYFRTDAQASELVHQIRSGSQKYVNEEIVRMDEVMSNFSNYRFIEAGFVIIGLLLILVIKEKSLWMGIGLGMLIQGSIMISLDLFAEKRGEIYLRSLKMENVDSIHV